MDKTILCAIRYNYTHIVGCVICSPLAKYCVCVCGGGGGEAG